MKKLGFWSDKEIISLFNYVEAEKKKSLSLLNIFDAFAKKTKRKRNSVRNYYYFQLKEFEKDESLAKKLDISLLNHSKKISMKFSEKDESLLFSKVMQLQKKGMSVRKACLELSNGNITEMVRLQNKIRFAKQKSKSDNVFKMPQKSTHISDDEINSLFLGLVKMVQKNAITAAENHVVNQISEKDNLIKEATTSINEKAMQILLLKEKIKQSEESYGIKVVKKMKTIEVLKTNVRALIEKYDHILKEFLVLQNSIKPELHNAEQSKKMDYIASLLRIDKIKIIND